MAPTVEAFFVNILNPFQLGSFINYFVETLLLPQKLKIFSPSEEHNGPCPMITIGFFDFFNNFVFYYISQFVSDETFTYNIILIC